MKRQTFTGVLLAICVVLLVALLPSVAPASAADSDPSPWPLRWVEKAPMPTPRSSPGVAVSNQQKIYVIGGDNYTCVPLSTVEEYNPWWNSWRARADLPTARWLLGAATGVDGQIYAIGGWAGGCGPEGSASAVVEAYNPWLDRWTTRASMPTARWLPGVVAGANGKIYAIGGENETGFLATVEEYDPIANTWTQKSDMPQPWSGFASVSASNGKIYVIGGFWGRDLVFEFDPVADTWVQKASYMPTGRDSFSAAEVTRVYFDWSERRLVKKGLIYAIGGIAEGPTGAVEVYDPATDSWLSATGLPGTRRFHAVAAVGNTVYAIGGWGVFADGSDGPVGWVEAARTPYLDWPFP
jgi:hypothetical protein